MNQKWYEKNVVIILFLIFFFPVGLFLMWKYSRWNMVAKIVISIVFGLAIIGNIGNSSKSVETKTDTAVSKIETTTETEQKKEDTVKQEEKKDTPKQEEKKDNKIKSGTYKIGTDIPAGEYLVIAKSMAYIECTKDSTGALDSIIFNDNLSSNSNSYVTLNDGEYFKLTGGEMYPVAEAPSIIPSDGLYKDGMYKVGKDIPAGEYKVKLTGSIGYTEVTTNSRHQLDSIVSNENVQADTYLTIQEGQYLKMTGVQIQK